MVNEILGFISQPTVLGFISEYTAAKGLDGLAALLIKRSEKQSLEWQFLTALDAALRETCKHENWEYDDTAICDTYLYEASKACEHHREDAMSDILSAAVGREVGEDTLRIFILFFHEAVAHPSREWLYRFLAMEEWFYKRNSVWTASYSDGESLALLTPALHVYLLAEVERYRREDILLKTPQVLLSLLKYPGSVLYRVLCEYDAKSCRYSDYLIRHYQLECVRYREQGFRYNADCDLRELLCMDAAKDIAARQAKGRISENILSCAVLSNTKSATTKKLLSTFGYQRLEEIKQKLLLDATPIAGEDGI
ncbi:MAG: hypothetical protein LBV12_10980 [Puniceicoccales bacterium]|jgi:hypothetical protein|nr:hypothetical protein [Puniceicoccales bacterium]